MLVRVNEIQIRKRIRRDLGNLNELAESLRQHGLMNPILITRDKTLIAGHRRLESAKKLGWTTIEANIIDNPGEIAILELEIDENLHRKNLTADEIVEAYSRLEKLKNPGFFSRIVMFFRKFLNRIFRIKI